MKVFKTLGVMVAAVLLTLLMWPLEIVLGVIDILLYPFLTASDFFRIMTEEE